MSWFLEKNLFTMCVGFLIPTPICESVNLAKILMVSLSNVAQLPEAFKSERKNKINENQANSS